MLRKKGQKLSSKMGKIVNFIAIIQKIVKLMLKTVLREHKEMQNRKNEEKSRRGLHSRSFDPVLGTCRDGFFCIGFDKKVLFRSFGLSNLHNSNSKL